MRSDPPILGSYWTLSGKTAPPPLEGQKWSPFPLQERVSKAAEIGFEGMGLWHTDVSRLRKRDSLEKVAEVFAEHEMSYLELEFLEYAHLVDENGDFDESNERLQLLLDAAEALDAHHVKIGNIAEKDVPTEQIKRVVADVSERFGTIGCEVGLEIIPFDVNLSGLDDGLDIVEDVDNAGIVLDTWHVMKMEIPFEELRAIPKEQLTSVELNDGFIDADIDLVQETTRHRKLPGDGEFPLREFVSAIRETGYDRPWGVEVLSDELRAKSMDEAYPEIYDKTAAYLSVD